MMIGNCYLSLESYLCIQLIKRPSKRGRRPFLGQRSLRYVGTSSWSGCLRHPLRPPPASSRLKDCYKFSEKTFSSKHYDDVTNVTNVTKRFKHNDVDAFKKSVNKRVDELQIKNSIHFFQLCNDIIGSKQAHTHFSQLTRKKDEIGLSRKKKTRRKSMENNTW